MRRSAHLYTFSFVCHNVLLNARRILSILIAWFG